MVAKLLTPQLHSGLGGKLPSNSEFITPMAIFKDQGRPLHKDLIYDNRDFPMDTLSIMSRQPAYDFANTNKPCLGTTDAAGIVNKRIKERNPVPNLFGCYPQPKTRTRDKVFGLSHTKCDIENVDNKILRSYNNFNVHQAPKFPEFKR